MRNVYVVDTDGDNVWYVVPYDDKAYVVQDGTHYNEESAKAHCNLLNERNRELSVYP